MNPINSDVSGRYITVIKRSSPESRSASTAAPSVPLSKLANGQMPPNAARHNADRSVTQSLIEKVTFQDAMKCVAPSTPLKCAKLEAPKPAFSQPNVVFEVRNPLDCLGAYCHDPKSVNITNLVLATPGVATDMGADATQESGLLYAAGAGALPSLTKSRCPQDTGRPEFWQLHTKALPLRYSSAVFQKLAALPEAIGSARLDAQAKALLEERVAPRFANGAFAMITFALPPLGTDPATVHDATLHQVGCALQRAAHREDDYFILSLPVESLHRQTRSDGNEAVEPPYLEAVAKAVVAALKLRSSVNVIIPADGSRLTALIKQYASDAAIGIAS